MALNRYVYDTSRDAVVTHAEGPKPNGTSYGATEDVSSPTAPVDDAEVWALTSTQRSRPQKRHNLQYACNVAR